mgnify:CR=1 FL=1
MAKAKPKAPKTVKFTLLQGTYIAREGNADGTDRRYKGPCLVSSKLPLDVMYKNKFVRAGAAPVPVNPQVPLVDTDAAISDDGPAVAQDVTDTFPVAAENDLVVKLQEGVGYFIYEKSDTEQAVNVGNPLADPDTLLNYLVQYTSEA